MARDLTNEIDRLRAELAAMKQDAREITTRADTMESSIRQLQQSLVSQRAGEHPEAPAADSSKP